MSLVDSSSVNDPNTSNRTSAAGRYEYTVRCCQIRFQAFKPTANGMTDNTGNIYVVRKEGSRDDTGTIVAIIKKGETYELPGHPAQGNILNPYRYLLDADNAQDGAIVTLFIGIG